MSASTLSELEIDNVNFTTIKSYDLGDQSNTILDIDGYDVSKTTNLLISNVIVSQAEQRFITFSKISNSVNSTKIFTFSNFEYKNSILYDKNNLIYFTKMELNTSFNFALTGIKFTNVTFPIKGNLIMIQHQLKNPLSIANLRVSNCKYGAIYMAAMNTQNKLLPTNILMTNLTTDKVNAGFQSFMQVYENTKLEIRDSSILYVFNFAEGAVLTAGYQQAEVNIYNTLIKFNSAIEGGVFKVQSSSIIRVYNSQILNNFAISAGVIKADNGGQFEINSSNITDNTSQQGLIGILYDAPIESVVRNCDIKNNKQYTKCKIF